MIFFKFRVLNLYISQHFRKEKSFLNSSPERFLELGLGNMCAGSKCFILPTSLHGGSPSKVPRGKRAPDAQEGLCQPAGVERQPAATGLCAGSTETMRLLKWGAILTVLSSTSMKNFTAWFEEKSIFNSCLRSSHPALLKPVSQNHT